MKTHRNLESDPLTTFRAVKSRLFTAYRSVKYARLQINARALERRSAFLAAAMGGWGLGAGRWERVWLRCVPKVEASNAFPVKLVRLARNRSQEMRLARRANLRSFAVEPMQRGGAVLILEEKIYDARRAAGTDLAGLTELWSAAGLEWKELQPQFADFYVATKGEQICGAIGLKIVKQQGCINSEAFVHPRAVEVLRPILWERVLKAAENGGAARVWVNGNVPECERYGFLAPDAESVWFFPEEFGVMSHRWRVKKFKDETPELVEELFQLDAEANKEMQKHHRTLARIGMIGAIIAVSCLIGFGIFIALLGRR